MSVKKYWLATCVSALAISGVACAADTLPSRATAMQQAAVSAGIPAGPNPDYGVALGDWLLYPTFFVGLIYNDNIYAQPYNRRSGVGMRMRPSLEAERDTGIHKTVAYARADFQLYPGRGQSYVFFPSYAQLTSPTNVTANAGFSHAYRPLPDLKFTVVGDYTRGSGGIFGGGFGVAGVGNIPNAVSLVSVGTYSNQFTGAAVVDKDFGNAFVRLGGTVQEVVYDSPSNNLWMNALFNGVPATKPPSSTNFTGVLRGGYWVTPQFYVFAEPAADIRRSTASVNDSNGYRVVAGLGSDLISLFRGEIYGGYMSQTSTRGYFGAKGSPTFGARLNYYPTRQLTLSATVDQSFTAPYVQATAPFGGLWVIYTPTAPTRTLQAKFQAEYKVADYWSTYARFGYGVSRSVGYYTYGSLLPTWSNGTSTNIWGAGAGMTYNVWRNLALTLEYNFSKSIPNSYTGANWWIYRTVTQNTVSAGLTYKY